MKKFCVLIVLNTFITLVLSGQCPDRDFLWKRLVYIRDSSSLISSSSEQLRELLGYESAITNCTYQYDSTHALLLQRIGVLYLLAEDYARATQFILESIHLYDKKKDKPGINSNELIRSYYILARIYGSLNLISAKMAAFDSCIAIRARTRSVDAYSLYSFKEKVEYLFDIGDYQRVINTAEMGESLIDQYTNEEERVNYAINFLTWKVNALLEFKDYRKAEKLIRSKIDDCRKTGAEEYLGNLYEQLAKVCVQKGSFHESEIFFQEALKYHQRDKYYLGCEQTLNNLGYSLYFRQYNDYNKAILTYKKALGYLSYDKSDSREYSIEALNTYANIGNAFGWKGDYDSSFYYFQLAFDQVKPGITEKDLIKNSLNEVIQFKKIRQIMALLLNKGDTYFRQYSKTGNKSSIEKAIHIYKLADQFGDAINKGQTEIS